MNKRLSRKNGSSINVVLVLDKATLVGTDRRLNLDNLIQEFLFVDLVERLGDLRAQTRAH